MADSQVHRGPDGAGMFQDRQAVLGHRRLAIIDLSAAGHQPMSNEDGSVWISFNGEIYNFGDLRAELVGRHCFRSSTDTEVLLHGYEQWGIEGLLERLRGMFALALWEPGTRRLTLARDRLGIKPLYYHNANGSVAFASEVRALLRSGIVSDEADPEALSQFLLFGSVPSPLTTAKAVRCLPPGHYAVATDRGVDLRKYWELGYPDTRCPAPDAGKGELEELRARLERSVREHLISDVPLGVFLSGGVDSAAIVALASRVRKDQRLTTLTVAFGEKGFDESQDALRIAHRFNTHHHELLVTSEDFAQEMPAFLAGMDQPTNDGVNTWFVSKAARQCGLTVVLSGLGGDEILCTARPWIANAPPGGRHGNSRSDLGVTLLPPELDLLLACGSPPSETARARISKLLSAPLDWPLLVELALTHGMTCLLARALAEQAPGPSYAEIQDRAAAFSMRSLRMAGELARIFKAFDSAGITAIGFKGSILAHLAYGDLALRTFNDLDIFVPRAQLPAALDLLAAEGYAKKTEAWDIGFSGACEIALQRRDPICEVDLHWLFSSPYFLPFDPVRAVERSVAFRAGGLAARTLRTEDHLLYLCIRAARAGWDQAQFPCDLAGIVARCALDWDDLIHQAERTGCWRALAVGLDLAHKLCESPIPPEVLRRVQCDRTVPWISAQAQLGLIRRVSDPAGTPAGALLHLRTLESWPAKARYLWRRALQPNQKDAEWIRLPQRLSAAYYVLRPLRLAYMLLRRLFR
jgi:hypothetical protein